MAVWIVDAGRNCLRRVSDATVTAWRKWLIAHPTWHTAGLVSAAGSLVACGAGVGLAFALHSSDVRAGRDAAALARLPSYGELQPSPDGQAVLDGLAALSNGTGRDTSPASREPVPIPAPGSAAIVALAVAVTLYMQRRR